ncbi:MAG: hypothetical protein AB7V62_01955 [Thermoleophilia bacterium]
MRRALAAALALVVAALALAGCTARLEVSSDIDKDGRGEVTLRLTLDTAAQEALGLPTDADPAEAAERFAPLLEDAGWTGGDGQIAATRDEETGELLLETTHLVDSTDQLGDIMSLDRPIVVIAPDPATFAALPDLPEEAPLLNAFDLRLGDRTGDHPGFDLFARGGVGEIGTETCAGNDVTGFARSLRDSLEIRYSFELPGGPGSTNADETPRGANVWNARYGDCPPLQASSGGGSSSTLVNGVILAALAAFLLLIFALRAVRRRRSSRPS